MEKREKGILRHRLEKEGRWGEADLWKTRYIRTQREMGRQGKDVNEEAWERLKERYPALTEVEIKAEAERRAEAGVKAEVARVEKRMEKEAARIAAEAGGEVIPLVVPKAWGRLPDRAPLRDEVEWVHQNRVLVIEERVGRQPKLNLRNALWPAPSHGALGILLDAARAPGKFAETVNRVLGDEESGEGELERRERKSVAEIEAILEKMEAMT